MIFDTDVLIWFFRGNVRAEKALRLAEHKVISVITLMELMAGARNKAEQQTIKKLVRTEEFMVLPLTEEIGSRAQYYVEKYAGSHGLSIPDALIAATSVESGDSLCTSNVRHFRAVPELELVALRIT